MKPLKQVYILSLFLIFSYSNLFAQPAFGWAYKTGAAQIDGGSSVIFDNANNPISCLNVNSSEKSVIRKRDAAGAIVWEKDIVSSNTIRSSEIDVDSDNNTIITGYYDGTVDFNPGSGTFNLSSVGGNDCFVLKLDENGSFLWAVSFGGSGADQSFDVAIDTNKGIVVSGRFQNTVDFNPGSGTDNETSVGSYDVFVLKLDENGIHQWAHAFGGTAYDNAWGIGVSPTNEVYINGKITGTIDFDPSAANADLVCDDLFIAKFSESGDYIWAKSFNGTGSGEGISIKISDNNNCYMVGKYSGTIDFDPGAGVHEQTSTGSPYHVFILKLSGTGDFVWVRHLEGGTGSYSSVHEIVIDPNENLYVCGNFQGDVDFDVNSGTSSVTVTEQDYFVLKLNSSSDFQWFINSGAPVNSSSEATGVAINVVQDIFITGSFSGTKDFNPGAATYPLTADWLDAFESFLTNPCTPTAPTPDIAMLQDVSFECSISTPSAPTASNCLGSFDGVSDVVFPISTPGTTTVTWTYDDLNGNTSTQTQNFINTPNALTPDIAMLQDINLECPISSPSAPTASNCLGSFDGVSDVTFPISTPGTTTVIWTYDDLNGNTSTQTQDFTYTPIDTSFTVMTSAPYTASATASGYNYQWFDCDLNSVVTSETNSSFTPTYNSTYALIIDNSFCFDTSSCQLIEIDLGLGEDVLGNLFSYFPNPTTGPVYFEFKQVYSTIDVVILNELGQVVQNNSFTNGAKISVELLVESGVYFAEITINSEETKQVRIIKK